MKRTSAVQVAVRTIAGIATPSARDQPKQDASQTGRARS
jgi:hypothetical protein